MLFLNEKKCPSWRKDSYHRHSHQFFFFHFQWKMKKKMTVNRWLSFSLAITKKKRKSYVTELESSFGHTFSLFCYWSPRTSLWSRPTCKEKRNSWPGFSWHNDSECYRQEKIKEKVGQAVSVSRAYCGPHQEREKERPTWISSWRTQPLVQLFLHILLAFNLHLTVGHHNNKGKLMANRMKMKPTGEGKHLLTNLITTARPFLFHVITH